MTTKTLSRSSALDRVIDRIDLQAVGEAVIRYGLAGVIGWIGLMKFTRLEAEAIWPLVQHSPLMSWASTALGVRLFSNVVGVVSRKLSVVANMPTARALPRAEARAATGRRAMRAAIVTSATPNRLENARTPRAVAAQAKSGLCAASGRMASASTCVNFIKPIQPMTPARP